MTAFEFAFTLFSLILGLALASVMSGYVNVLKARSRRPDEQITIRMGWLTPVLALLVSFDLITFWLAAWISRDAVVFSPSAMLFSAILTGIYFIAASLVFPNEPEFWPDLDHWFDRHKGHIGGGVAAANIGFTVLHILGGALTLGTVDWMNYVWPLLWLSLMFTRRRWQSRIAIVGLVALMLTILATW